MKKYNDINFLPLDLPFASCDPKSIKSFMDTRGKRTDYLWTKQVNDPWRHVVVRVPEIEPLSDEIPGSGWRIDFKKRFSDVVKVVEMMPYNRIDYVYILEQIIEVKPHLDVASKNPLEDLEPATYRITLLMEDDETFYICNDNKCNEIIYPTFPKETNSWVFSNKNFMHGSKLSEKSARKVLLAVGGELNLEKHIELLNQSYTKYSMYAF